ncbi:RagB/SusD family nutrient uptake outer membrane protein [Hwangdonia lutea]|uniref:RagB/SusD family nutrient uptake outer membrane protein n=1 Tax=Hwangdonia lutea TaxID=3075823 RepID=A0AA97EQ36_9FLAO|nr:RagB/SusD family nutrient uptake outer membrane protein [Hwangdonia sp. SCSIO 19198]WOD44404.1 RagB/SusD family nutrient uptake outer membrane protein [Hwangdonia sp. SCSIO 19198]
MANSSPEALLTINTSVEDGQYAFFREYSTNFEDTGGRHDDFGQMSINLGLDLMSNDMVQVTDHWMGNYYAYRGRTQDFSTTRIIWNFYYSIINNVNSVISQIPADATDDRLIHLRARTQALRAYCYFNLIRIYQHKYQGNQSAPGIPLYAYEQEISNISRTPVQEVYDLILSDLEEAYAAADGYVRDTKEKLDKSVIAGIYARVLLETGTNDTKCAQMASEAKAAGSLMTSSAWLNEGFSQISNSEWLWGSDINGESSTVYASFFSQVASLNQGYAGLLGVHKTIDKRLYDAIPASDARKQAFADDGTYINYKFRDFTFFEGDYVYMRVAEMYLIEAEALARSGNDSQAAQVLYNLVSTRDSGYTLSTNTGQALIDEILLQRRIELWGEGFAWFDMKRNDVALERDYPGSNHASFGKDNFAAGAKEFLFQIPKKELDANVEINDEDQNPL